MNSAIWEEMIWVHSGMVLLILSLFLYVARIFSLNRLLWHAAWGALALATASLVGSLVLRSIEAGFFALSNMYESLLVLSISTMVGFLVLDRWFSLRGIGWPVCLMLVAMMGFAISLPMEITPLQAALQSYWRSIHVPVILASYAMFTLSFIASILYLVQDARVKGATAAVDGPALSAEETHDLSLQMEQQAQTEAKKTSQGAFAMSATDIYDEVTYRCIAVGFPLLAIGIILGGLWANEAWGNYWSWDPKESMSLVTLLAYGVYLHLRVKGDHSQRTLAWVSVGGYLLMLLTYFGVNIMGVGLHSYGKIG